LEKNLSVKGANLKKEDQMAEKKGNGLQGALDTLKTAVGDLTSLEVQTYTGSIKIEEIKDKDGNILSPVKFEDYLKGAISSPDDLELVAVTKMNFDGDTINLVPKGGFPEHVQRAHEAAVKAGIDTRHGLLALFGDMIGLTKKK